MTKIERPFLAAKGFNTNLVQYLLAYHVIKDTHREKAPSNKTPALTQSTNMGI